jgi:hypothetical protein
MANKLIVALLGIGAFVLWARFSADAESLVETSSLPAVVLGGGGGSVEIRFTTNQPADLVFAFERYDEDSEDGSGMGGWESFDPGTHVRTVEVSPETYIYLELGVPEATPGAELSWSVLVDGTEIVGESDRLEQELRSGTAFFFQVEADDIAELRSRR